MTFTLHLGDCLEVLKTFSDNSIDRIVTDPPYGLSFMGKKWDYDVPSVEIWKECLKVLKPGGHLLSFSSARTYHRMVVNVEDAGFEIRDQLMWVYGSGFPKNHNVAKYIHKLKTDGNCREVKNKGVGNTNGKFFQSGKHLASGKGALDNREQSPEDQDWKGWGTALKPAHEPIVMARKPISEDNIAKNVLKWGTGAINIDKSRVPTDETITTHSKSGSYDEIYSVYGKIETHQTPGQELGRFPANFIHDGIDAEWSRYFYCAKASKAERNKGCEDLPIKRPDARTSTGMGTFEEKGVQPGHNHHPTVKPIKLMSYLCGLITPPQGVVLDPFMGSGSTGLAAIASEFQFVGIEMDGDYLNIAKCRLESTER